MPLNTATIPALMGLGLYAQANNLNLSNNTTMLIELFMLMQQQAEVQTALNEIRRLDRAVFGIPYDVPYISNPYANPYTTPYCTPVTNTTPITPHCTCY
jgi:hypothetical protein